MSGVSQVSKRPWPEDSSQPRKRRRSRWGSAKKLDDGPRVEVRKEQNGELKKRTGWGPTENGVGSVDTKDSSHENAKVRGRRWGEKAEGFEVFKGGMSRGLEVDVRAIPVAPVSTLKINRSKAWEKKLNKVMKVKEEDLLETDPEKNPYFDARLKVSSEPRRQFKKGFNFVTQGALIAKAEKQRRRAEAMALTAELRERMAARSEASAAVPILPPYMDERPPVGKSRDLPDVEWWDAPFLVGGKYEDDVKDENSIQLRDGKITSYVHHPVSVNPARKERALPAMPIMLTEKERKRLRHQRRMDKVQEQQEMIQIGLMPAPPPKVKLSNMMRVLANESSADPTRVEKEVRAQMEKRISDHLARNEARKKTKEQKREKAAQKAEMDRQAGMQAAVFRILNVANPQHCFKISKNAEQLELGGAFVYYEDCNVVVVEGGPKAIRRYKNLMLRRIDWSLKNPDEEETGEVTNQVKNQCVLVWEGAVVQPAFKGVFKSATIPTAEGCRAFFRRRRVEHYWNLAISFPVGDFTLGQRSIK